MNRFAMIAGLAFVALLAGCSASDGTSQEPGASTPIPKSVEPIGIYRVVGSPDYLWLKLQSDGRYGTWAAGETCNKNPATAPASCLATGDYVIDESLGEIAFTDDLTRTQVITPYEVTAMGFPTDGTVSTMNTGGSGGSGSGGSGSGSNGSSDSQKPVATALNLRKCIHTVAMVCNLFWGGETLPEIQRPLPPRVTVSQG
jgi:hypothetical protein